MTQYIGFGDNCTVADVLNKGGLRKFSLPFDFLFAFPCHIKDSLDRDFQDWLDPQYLKVVQRPKDLVDQSYLTEHLLYDSHTKGMREYYGIPHGFFNHHDVISEKGRKIFERRIERYREIIASDEEVVLVTTSDPKTMESVGLSNYYHNRKAPTTLVYLQKISFETGPEAAKFVKSNGKNIIKFKCQGEYTDGVSQMICDELRKYFP